MDTLKQMAKDLGQEKAAELLGCSQGMLSQVLLGNKRFSAETAVEIEQRAEKWPKAIRSKYPVKRAELRPDLYEAAA